MRIEEIDESNNQRGEPINAIFKICIKRRGMGLEEPSMRLEHDEGNLSELRLETIRYRIPYASIPT